MRPTRISTRSKSATVIRFMPGRILRLMMNSCSRPAGRLRVGLVALVCAPAFPVPHGARAAAAFPLPVPDALGGPGTRPRPPPPDPVIGVAGRQQGQLERLIRLGLPVLAVEARSLEETFAQISLLGRVTGRGAAAGPLLGGRGARAGGG